MNRQDLHHVLTLYQEAMDMELDLIVREKTKIRNSLQDDSDGRLMWLNREYIKLEAMHDCITTILNDLKYKTPDEMQQKYEAYRDEVKRMKSRQTYE